MEVYVFLIYLCVSIVFWTMGRRSGERDMRRRCVLRWKIERRKHRQLHAWTRQWLQKHGIQTAEQRRQEGKAT